MSTNKVYGDRPNGLKLVETEKRIDFADPNFAKGINEELSVDQSTHSVFGCSKLAADILAQEYGRNFGLRVGVFRGGCLTGPNHSGVKLHGFLSYIVKCAVSNEPYTIFGYGGKQVRDQIHSKDVVSAFKMFVSRPKCGAVYNLGGGRENSASIIEIIELLESITEKKMRYEYDESNRVGDHKCYYSDLTKFERDFPEWELRYSLSEIVEEMVRRSFMDITGSK
jgi:CDP-paratose 2-epimerase